MITLYAIGGLFTVGVVHRALEVRAKQGITVPWATVTGTMYLAAFTVWPLVLGYAVAKFLYKAED
jgi:hypothetical protein